MTNNLPKQNPFSLYDLIGYFIPGFIILLGISYLIDVNINEIFHDFVKGVCPKSDKALNQSTSASIIISLCIFISSYVLGHIIGILSAEMLEKLYFIKFFHYPSHYSFNISRNDKNAYKLTCVHFLLILFFIPISIILGILYLSNKEMLLGKLKHRLPEVVVKSKISDIMKEYYKDDNFNIDDELANNKSNYFELIYHYVLEHNTSHNFKMINYVALYGFFRNLSFAAIVLGWLSILAPCFNSLCQLSWVNTTVLIISGIITFLGFVKFYNRFNREVLYAGSVLISKQDSKTVEDISSTPGEALAK